jgi:hypothetical protein
MAASITIIELNGAAPGAPTDKTSGTVRFKNADNATVDLVNPLVVPTANTEYSYQKYLRLRDNGDNYTQITDIRAYSDGTGYEHGSPETAKLWYATSAGYAAPEVPTETVDPPQYPNSGSPTAAMENLFDAVSGSPIDLDTHFPGPYTPGSPLEFIGDFLVLVAEIEVGAAQGLLTAETLTWAWDEI